MASKGGRRPRRRQSLKLFSCIAPWRRSRKKEPKVTFSFIVFKDCVGFLCNIGVSGCSFRVGYRNKYGIAVAICNCQVHYIITDRMLQPDLKGSDSSDEINLIL